MDTNNPEPLFTERYYEAKLQELQAELQLLREFRHPKYLAAIQKLENDYKEELEFEETSEKLESERIEAEYEREQEAANRELEERISELMETMIQECEEQRKHIEHEYHNTDINSAQSSSYPVNKKTLRRRPNEPTPFNEKRMRTKNPQQVVYTLTDNEMLNDLRIATTNANGNANGNGSSSANTNTNTNANANATTTANNATSISSNSNSSSITINSGTTTNNTTTTSITNTPTTGTGTGNSSGNGNANGNGNGHSNVYADMSIANVNASASTSTSAGANANANCCIGGSQINNDRLVFDEQQHHKTGYNLRCET